MMTNKVMSGTLGALLMLGLTGCAEQEPKGLERIEGLETPVAAQPTVSGNHQAPPLSELGAAPHAHDLPASDGSDMTIEAGTTEVMAGGNILQVAGLAFTVSEDWKFTKPANPIRVAEYELNGSGGPAEMAVFYFGQGQGGGIEDNIRRWVGQFSSDDSGQTGADVARTEKDNLQLALVKTEGTYDPGTMAPAMAAQGPKENYALFGLVVAGGPEGSVFIKVTGPKETVKEHNEALEAMAQSVRVSGYK